ncbi:GNAT family N-acetyltransferase [Planococcus shenhongbingii]|uniref:GNAT family N-acetyltransferase n=1 Tax=Planococcus shenhongbingii TaxID=3058398 RepID=A0ABT8NDM4_9BACL|nr:MULTISPECIES: GNAT family N-acetyltransferase [unclassified Planococcus (in: firmicutes)]MDN7245997.1 GNAT family N-acetyltransferase [Planococcus sp. N017]WKA59873.1 GNAT family N-acetyltransferase [Planococcus sp. N016]
MVLICKAEPEHVKGIARVCTEGYWATYSEMFSKKYIKAVVQEFYNEKRILNEVTNSGKEWGGYFVALEDGEVIGAGGGGMIAETTGEVFVLYLDPIRRGEGIGTMLLDAITRQQKEEFGAKDQWVSVAKENQKGIPFYEAREFICCSEQPVYRSIEKENPVSLRYWRRL